MAFQDQISLPNKREGNTPVPLFRCNGRLQNQLHAVHFLRIILIDPWAEYGTMRLLPRPQAIGPDQELGKASFFAAQTPLPDHPAGPLPVSNRNCPSIA